MSRITSILISLLIYCVVICLLVFISGFFPDYPVWVKIGLADLLGTLLIFVASLVFNNSSMYDPYWSVKPMVIAVYLYVLLPVESRNLLHLLTLILVGLYALRLTSNFYRDWPGMKHEDWRYRNFRVKFPRLYWMVSFFGIHLFPSVMVYLGCLPMLVIFSENAELTTLALVGEGVLLGSIILAFVADEQLRKFRLLSENSGKTIRSGLWSFSRHPNYLGEIMTWWGLFFIALSIGLEYWQTGIGALTITLMFIFISIPLIEKYAISRRDDYQDYKMHTPMLFSLLKRK